MAKPRKQGKSEGGTKLVAQNRRASHDYFLEDRYEAGLMLQGTEVKTLRAVERLAQTPPWREVDRALRTDRGLRGRLFATLGSSTALGDHLIAHPDRWTLLADTADRRSPPPDLARRTATLLRAVAGLIPAAPPVEAIAVELP